MWLARKIQDEDLEGSPAEGEKAESQPARISKEKVGRQTSDPHISTWPAKST